MAKNSFTPEQTRAVYDSGMDILVSASAGSGKTTVLVQRVMEKILAKNNPVPVKNMLIVTFTEAAASEMKEKIRKAIESELAKDPTNSFLNQQLIDVSSANISTLHAFCLDVIRRFYYCIDLDPSFSLMTDDTQIQLLTDQAVENVLTANFTKKDKKFFDFLENFTGNREFETAKSLILDLYKTAIAMPNYHEFFDKSRSLYSINDSDLLQSKVYQELINKAVFKEFSSIYKQMGDFFGPEYSNEPNLDKMVNSITEMKDAIDVFLNKLMDGKSYDETREALKNCLPTRTAKSSKWDQEVIDLYDKAATFRKHVKERVLDTFTNFFVLEEAKQRSELQTSSEIFDELITLEEEFLIEYSSQKRSKNYLDFNDLEQFAFQILTQEDTNSVIAQKFYQNKFTEILVDEYQDTNPIQEQIVQSIKKDGQNNLFMVGDVKQSIYAFRQAEPKLFLSKYEAFKEKSTGHERIILADNFRSTVAVTSFVNRVFNPLMTKDFGGIDYKNEGQLLFGAKYYPDSLPDAVEVALFDKAKLLDKSSQDNKFDFEEATDDLAAEVPESEMELDFNEIQMVIARIKQMQRDHFQVFAGIDENGHKLLRELKPSDIAILTPTRSNNLNILEEFNKAELPLFISDAQNYFQTLELTIIMSYLKIIDNPDQDIPLVSVMRSPVYGFDEQELAQIRLANKSVSFYKSLKQFSANNQLGLKVTNFLNDLSDFRKFEKLHRISELIWHIYEQTRLLDIVTAFPNFKQRRVNLETLYERASSFESAGFKGLYQFINFIKRMQKKNKDLAQPLLADAAEDSIRLMTIHGSKGLEFPIVFIVGLTSRFNQSDLTNDYIIDSHLGVGLTNKHEYVKIDSVVKNALVKKARQNLLEEKARVLYVALTRAQQKLILVCAPNSMEQLVNKWSNPQFDLAEKLTATSFLDMIAPVLHLDESIKKTPKQITNSMLENESLLFINYEQSDLTDQTLLVPNLNESAQVSRQEVDKNLLYQTTKQLFTFKYPFEKSTITTAYQAVSEIKQLYNDPDVIELQNAQIIEATNRYLAPISAKPTFLTKNEFTAADIGTATHLILQKHDFSRAAASDVLSDEIQRLVNDEQLDEDLAKMVNQANILKFLSSEFAQEITNHVDTLEREVSFSTLLKASKLFKEFSDESSKILVHGTIDGYYQTESGIVLFDYKTDGVPSGELGLQKLIDKYAGQLRFYEQAITEFTGMPIKNKYLISLKNNEIIEVK